MAIQVLEMVGIISAAVGNRYAVLKTFDTFAEAAEYVQSLKPVCFEPDADYPDCGDAILQDGRLLAIQPEGFKL